ncbi:hypothetical protein OIU85_012509 [Salix viminalis]|uniref:Uncharacterized protein n=1 Tax=Salix viminalis TaxID=40686 RepID=A0A9Q0NPF8_SALVM|nr:hypothetical protein OIU85_012509 [Salix viminalis]
MATIFEAHTPQEKYKSQFQQQAHHIKPLEEMKLLYPVGNFISHYQIKPPEEMKLLYPVGNFISHYQIKPPEEMKLLYPVGNLIPTTSYPAGPPPIEHKIEKLTGAKFDEQKVEYRTR